MVQRGRFFVRKGQSNFKRWINAGPGIHRCLDHVGARNSPERPPIDVQGKGRKSVALAKARLVAEPLPLDVGDGEVSQVARWRALAPHLEDGVLEPIMTAVSSLEVPRVVPPLGKRIVWPCIGGQHERGRRRRLEPRHVRQWRSWPCARDDERKCRGEPKMQPPADGPKVLSARHAPSPAPPSAAASAAPTSSTHPAAASSPGPAAPVRAWRRGTPQWPSPGRAP